MTLTDRLLVDGQPSGGPDVLAFDPDAVRPTFLAAPATPCKAPRTIESDAHALAAPLRDEQRRRSRSVLACRGPTAVLAASSWS